MTQSRRLLAGCLGSALALTFACTAAHAAMPPPDWPAAAAPITVRSDPVSQITVGPLQVDLGHTTFDDVQDALGFSPLQMHGDADNVERWMCYTIPRLSARVWLRSGGVGDRKYVNGLSAQLVGLKSAATEECPNVILRDNRVMTASGVELGSPVRDPSSRKAMLSYVYAGGDGAPDVGSTLTMKVAAGKVVEIHATHTAAR